jgi:hypothetical protein
MSEEVELQNEINSYKEQVSLSINLDSFLLLLRMRIFYRN